MKVLQILTQLESAGAQMVAYELEQQIGRQPSNDTPVLVSTVALYYKQDIEDWTSSRALHPTRPAIWELPSLIQRLWKMCRHHDVILAHAHYCSAIVAMLMRLSGKPVVVVHHGPRSTLPKFAKVLDSIAAVINGYAYEVAVSGPVADELRKSRTRRERSKVTVIDNPLSQLFSRQLKRSDRRSQASTERSKFRLVAVGRLVEQKNHQLAIRAVADVGRSISLDIFGTGPLADQLTATVGSLNLNDRVVLRGRVPHSTLLENLQSSDAVISSSRWEAAPMSLIEASSCGLPIIASDIPAHRYTLGDSAVFYDSSSPSAAAQAITKVANDPDLRQILRTRSLSNLERFRPELCASRYMTLLEIVFTTHCAKR
jgi:glycosyltransferase involved in cell wall biosynthesis